MLALVWSQAGTPLFALRCTDASSIPLVDVCKLGRMQGALRAILTASESTACLTFSSMRLPLVMDSGDTQVFTCIGVATPVASLSILAPAGPATASQIGWRGGAEADEDEEEGEKDSLATCVLAALTRVCEAVPSSVPWYASLEKVRGCLEAQVTADAVAQRELEARGVKGIIEEVTDDRHQLRTLLLGGGLDGSSDRGVCAMVLSRVARFVGMYHEDGCVCVARCLGRPLASTSGARRIWKMLESEVRLATKMARQRPIASAQGPHHLVVGTVLCDPGSASHWGLAIAFEVLPFMGAAAVAEHGKCEPVRLFCVAVVPTPEAPGGWLSGTEAPLHFYVARDHGAQDIRFISLAPVSASGSEASGIRSCAVAPPLAVFAASRLQDVEAMFLS